MLLIELYLFNTHIQGVTCDVGYAPNRFKLRIRIHSYAIRVWLLNSYITNKTWWEKDSNFFNIYLLNSSTFHLNIILISIKFFIFCFWFYLSCNLLMLTFADTALEPYSFWGETVFSRGWFSVDMLMMMMIGTLLVISLHEALKQCVSVYLLINLCISNGVTS